MEADRAEWVAASLEPGPLEIYVPFGRDLLSNFLEESAMCGAGARFWLGFPLVQFGSVRFGLFASATNDTKSPWPMTAAGASRRSWLTGSQALAQWQAETGKCFFTIKMMDEIINNVGVRPNRGFPVVVYFDINEIPLSFFLSALIFGHQEEKENFLPQKYTKNVYFIFFWHREKYLRGLANANGELSIPSPLFTLSGSKINVR